MTMMKYDRVKAVPRVNLDTVQNLKLKKWYLKHQYLNTNNTHEYKKDFCKRGVRTPDCLHRCQECYFA